MINKFKPVNNQIDVVPLVHACPLFTHDVHACLLFTHDVHACLLFTHVVRACLFMTFWLILSEINLLALSMADLEGFLIWNMVAQGKRP